MIIRNKYFFPQLTTPLLCCTCTPCVRLPCGPIESAVRAAKGSDGRERVRGWERTAGCAGRGGHVTEDAWRPCPTRRYVEPTCQWLAPLGESHHSGSLARAPVPPHFALVPGNGPGDEMHPHEMTRRCLENDDY